MKTNKLMLAAMLFGAVAMVSCEKEKETDPVIPTPTPTTPTEEIEGTDGAVTLIVDLADEALTTTTTDIYFVGKYKDAEGVEYSWDPTPAGSLKMTKLTDTRYKLVLYPTEASETTCNETGEDVKVQCVIAGKATLKDEKKTWGYCWQYKTVSATGDYQLRAENSGEYRLVVEESDPLGGVVYVTVKGWNGDPTATDFTEATYAKIKCEANGWNFEDMAAVGGGVFESAVYTLAEATTNEDGTTSTNHGCNLESDGDNLDWYAQDNIEGWSVELAGKSVKYVYTSKTNTVSIKLAE